jgi:signal peptidase I
MGNVIREIGESVVLIAVIYTLVNLASARFVVEGRSMYPNFDNDQFIIVSRVNYMLAEPKRGEIVVFEYPNDPRQDYIKRVIGLPGDTVEIRDTQVYVNGKMLNEPYINEPCTPSSCADNAWTLGPDQFFVMGDNRNHSSDSRAFGPVERHFIVGEALVRYWPPSAWGIIRGYESQGT